MRLFRATYKDRAGRKRTAMKWYVEFTDHLSKRRRLAAFTDKKASAEFGRKMDELVAYRVSGERPAGELSRWIGSLPAALRDRLAYIGLLDNRHVAASKPLTEHLEDWQADLQAKGNTKQHVALTAKRAETVIGGCAFRYFADIQAARVQRFLADLREGEGGLGARSSNGYLAAVKQFCKWMVREGRAGETPLDHLRRMNIEVDKRLRRRALTLDEIRQLLKAARDGESLYGMSGQDREMTYRVALETGLRWSELCCLRRESFDLVSAPPTVTVEAGYSKHRREDTLPLRESTAAALSTYLRPRMPTEKAFPMPKSKAGAEILREDLKAAGIPYRDSSGRVADFHALRHTFITNLANSGVHPSTAQRLARHCDVNLTLSHYTHSTLERQSEAVERLPDIGPQAEVARATGTDGGTVLASCLAKQERFRPIDADQSRRRKGKSEASLQGLRSPQKGPRGRFEGEKELVRAVGIEPTAYGLKVRCSTWLSYTLCAEPLL